MFLARKFKLVILQIFIKNLDFMREISNKSKKVKASFYRENSNISNIFFQIFVFSAKIQIYFIRCPKFERFTFGNSSRDKYENDLKNGFLSTVAKFLTRKNGTARPNYSSKSVDMTCHVLQIRSSCANSLALRNFFWTWVDGAKVRKYVARQRKT